MMTIVITVSMVVIQVEVVAVVMAVAADGSSWVVCVCVYSQPNFRFFGGEGFLVTRSNRVRFDLVPRGLSVVLL